MLFRNEFYFLSNMFNCTVMYNDCTYRCAESAFQSQKCVDEEEKELFAHMDGFLAKRYGKKVSLRKDWNKVRVPIMEEVVRAKFEQHPELARKLAKIEGVIQEDNSWEDTFWGVCEGKGENNLGKILMKIRDELNNSSSIIKIKETKASYKRGIYWEPKIFKKVSSQKGDLCLINGDIVSSEEGNKIFLSCKKKEEFSFETSEKEVLKEELISSYRKQINNYVEYIENYNQQKKAEENNERLLNIISALTNL